MPTAEAATAQIFHERAIGQGIVRVNPDADFKSRRAKRALQ